MSYKGSGNTRLLLWVEFWTQFWRFHSNSSVFVFLRRLVFNFSIYKNKNLSGAQGLFPFTASQTSWCSSTICSPGTWESELFISFRGKIQKCFLTHFINKHKWQEIWTIISYQFSGLQLCFSSRCFSYPKMLQTCRNILSLFLVENLLRNVWKKTFISYILFIYL